MFTFKSKIQLELIFDLSCKVRVKINVFPILTSELLAYTEKYLLPLLCSTSVI